MSVIVRIEEIVIPTYMPAEPDRNPMFLEKRVYQGSDGTVYPLPFTDRIASTPIDRKWKGVWIENEFLRVLVLPEIGGRIHIAQDKTNGYDIIYRQNVIKPALVGLAGPWISGGIEFNWPQHHRPATFLPVDFQIEEHPDGSKMIWCSDHDPLSRMKGMHGVCLHPDRSYIELKVRAYNRTPLVQTFLWWANVATRVHEAYQSFFPPDVYYVADHARRSMSEYPLCMGHYYGVDYGRRGREGTPLGEYPADFVPPNCGGKAPENYPPNDLSFYANIPVPTSYMCMGSREDFFGGYDHAAQAGIVHVANHHISPGKKQWTWGNHEFGYAWDRNLTDRDGPYIEIMAGVYTDNQPDFSFLRPGETKSWSQHWYPIQKIGPAQHANLDAAVSLSLEKSAIRVGVSVSRRIEAATIELRQEEQGGLAVSWSADLSPGSPFVIEQPQPGGRFVAGKALLRVIDSHGNEVISYRPKIRKKGDVPGPATEPDAPEKIGSVDELYMTGLHLEQYRHATRCPTAYWREALRRDPLDARCNNAMGLWHLRRGELDAAELHFNRAIERLTCRNGNPYDGEPLYNLGLCLRAQLDGASNIEAAGDRFDRAYAAFYKATWNQAWGAAGYHAVAELDCRRGDLNAALDHLNRSLRLNTDNLRARDLKTLVLQKLGRADEAAALLRETLAMDPLDWWARGLSGQPVICDLQAALDIAHDFARAGLYRDAISLLEKRIAAQLLSSNAHSLPDQSWGAMPLVLYTLGWLHSRAAANGAAAAYCLRASEHAPDYCFPSRAEEIVILEFAMKLNPRDARAPYYLGNLLYDRRRHREAIAMWRRSVKLDPKFSVPWRNLGIGYFNILGSGAKARQAYDKALAANPADARLLYERDQLWKRLGSSPQKRLRELKQHWNLVDLRDDLTIELASLHNQTGDHAAALALLSDRRFQPWEGGEGAATGQFVRAHLSLGRISLREGDPASAAGHFQKALLVPPNLGEAKHLLANQSDIHYWLGVALDAAGSKNQAKAHWSAAAEFKGDFQNMSVRVFSEMTYYSALSMRRLGRKRSADGLLRNLLKYAKSLFNSDVKIDYFATSLPTMLLFDDDLKHRQQTTSLFLQAQAQTGLGATGKARTLLKQVLKRDPNHAMAADLLEESQSK